ncbi:MAG: hypothetical protein GEV12_19900 [Micromonosporaceae bacterium]|nr:hypothetical protein [Micromonosporaceae bacterium]
MSRTSAGNRPTALPGLLYMLCITPLLRRLITVHTVPPGRPHRSRCHRCATPVWPAACRPSARCRGCGRPVGPPRYTVEIAAAASVALLVWSGARGWELAGYTTWAMAMIVLGFVDAAAYRLPHQLTTAATLALVAFLALAGGTVAAWLVAAAAATGLAGFHVVLHAAAPSGLGLGDVTMSIPVGFALGWLDWRYVVAAVFLAYAATLLGFTALRMTGRRGSHQPFGAYLAAASVTIVIAAQVSAR